MRELRNTFRRGRQDRKRAANRRGVTVIFGCAFLLFLVAVPESAEVAQPGTRPAGEPPPVRVEPGTKTVPANHLKFYLHFPGPMERGVVFRHLRLVEIDETGRERGEVPEPFREVELWDESLTRLTLWFHPGRQKPGVNLNVEIGPILEEGKRYRLVILPGWKREDGRRLGGEEIRHEFFAGPIDETQPDPAEWRPLRVRGGDLVFRTEEVLDPESLRKSVEVFDAVGQRVETTATQSGDEIILRREGEWTRAKYDLVVAARLEDLAGNSIARPFNLDREQYPDFVERTEPVRVVVSLADFDDAIPPDR